MRAGWGPTWLTSYGKVKMVVMKYLMEHGPFKTSGSREGT